MRAVSVHADSSRGQASAHEQPKHIVQPMQLQAFQLLELALGYSLGVVQVTRRCDVIFILHATAKHAVP